MQKHSDLYFNPLAKEHLSNKLETNSQNLKALSLKEKHLHLNDNLLSNKGSQSIEQVNSTDFTVKRIDSIEQVKLLSISRVARILGLRTEAVDSLINNGKIRAIFIGKRKKIPFVEIVRFINDNLEVCQPHTTQQRLSVVKPKFNFQKDSFNSRDFVQKIMGE